MREAIIVDHSAIMRGIEMVVREETGVEVSDSRIEFEVMTDDGRLFTHRNASLRAVAAVDHKDLMGRYRWRTECLECGHSLLDYENKNGQPCPVCGCEMRG